DNVVPSSDAACCSSSFCSRVTRASRRSCLGGNGTAIADPPVLQQCTATCRTRKELAMGSATWPSTEGRLASRAALADVREEEAEWPVRARPGPTPSGRCARAVAGRAMALRQWVQPLRVCARAQRRSCGQGPRIVVRCAGGEGSSGMWACECGSTPGEERQDAEG